MCVTQRVILVLLLVKTGITLEETQPSVLESFDSTPDCDADFALHALALIQSKLADLQKLQQVEAVLASCNKPMLQKLTEASIRLLHKGIIPTQLTEQLQQLAAARKKTKREKFQKLEQDAPPEYKEIIHYIGSINTNDSLSGNEKLLYIQTRLLRLKSQERLELRRMLTDSVATTMTPVISKKIIIPPPPPVISHSLLPALAPPLPIDKQEPLAVPLEAQKLNLNVSIPPSFSIPHESESLLFSTKRLFEDRMQLPTREDNPSLFLRTFPIGVKEFPTLPTKTEPEVAPRPRETPIVAQVLNQGRPITGLEDSDLLKSRNNIWAEAAKFFDQSTNIPQQIRKFIEDNALRNGILKGNPQILAGLNVPANSFPLPAGVYEQLSKAYSDNTQAKRYLPVRRRDAIIPEVRHKGLDRFDTNLGRFQTGDPSPRTILAPIPVENRVVPERVEQKITTVLPVIESTTTSKILEGGYIQVPDRAPGFVQIPTYPPAPPGPERFIITTTIQPAVQEKSKDKLSVDRFPSFPSIDTTMTPPTTEHAFVPYKGPEEITGSRMYPKEPFNQNTFGQRRFVKIDLLNEH